MAIFDFGVNLIDNGDAEGLVGDDGARIPPVAWSGKDTDRAPTVVPAPNGWTRIGLLTTLAYNARPTDDLVHLDPGGRPNTDGPDDCGTYYFVGGPELAASSGTQIIEIPAWAKPTISHGRIIYVLSGWLGGCLGQPDRADLQITFKSLGGAALDTAKILSPHKSGELATKTGLSYAVREGIVPPQTASIEVLLDMPLPVTGLQDNDGYADNLSLVLINPPLPPRGSGDPPPPVDIAKNDVPPLPLVVPVWVTVYIFGDGRVLQVSRITGQIRVVPPTGPLPPVGGHGPRDQVSIAMTIWDLAAEISDTQAREAMQRLALEAASKAVKALAQSQNG